MAKLSLVLTVTIALQACINAAPEPENHPIHTIDENQKTDPANPALNSEPRVPEADRVTDDKTLQGQRQKRFYDYFDFDYAPFRPHNYNYIKRDDSLNTGVHGTQDFMLQILRRVQTILNYTRQQALAPPVAHYPVPSFIPIYVPRVVCDCTPAETPNNAEDTSSARPTLPTTAAPPTLSTTQGISPANVPGPSQTDVPNITAPDLSDRSNMSDEEDGSRPISLVPVTPKRPLSRPPPAVDHGSNQASSGNGVKEITTEAPDQLFQPLPPEPFLPTDSIPTLCDGAVLTCCHRAEVTYKCFTSQGCPNPSSPDKPCDDSVILKVIKKFQYYYANRRG